MELGFDIYFLIVFGFGRLLMLGLIVYFLREFIIRGDRPAWSACTLKSKFSYNGEPHHLRRRADQRDYAARMAEFFDYELKSGPNPHGWKQASPTSTPPSKPPLNSEYLQVVVSHSGFGTITNQAPYH